MRKGSFDSPTAGYIDLNQDLIDPMQEEYCKYWDKVLGQLIPELLEKISSKISEQTLSVIMEMQTTRRKCKVISCDWDSNAKRRSSSIIARMSLQTDQAVSSKRRALSHSVKEYIKDKMNYPYQLAIEGGGGTGALKRMTKAIVENTDLGTMFDEAKGHLIGGVGSLLESLHDELTDSVKETTSMLESVYSTIWENQDEAEIEVPAEFLLELSRLRQEQSDARNKFADGALCLKIESDEMVDVDSGLHEKTVSEKDTNCVSSREAVSGSDANGASCRGGDSECDESNEDTDDTEEEDDEDDVEEDCEEEDDDADDNEEKEERDDGIDNGGDDDIDNGGDDDIDNGGDDSTDGNCGEEDHKGEDNGKKELFESSD
jgi:hypothetical protein